MMKLPRISVRSRIAAAAAAAALAGGAPLAAAGPASASTSVPVTIQATVIIGPFTGTWTASGGINDSGTLVQPVDFRVGQGRVVHLMRVMTGSKGTITLVEDNLIGTPVGQWAIIAGTGAYTQLHGDGTTSGVVVNGVVTDTLTGTVHFD
jgi:hypothetical protein